MIKKTILALTFTLLGSAAIISGQEIKSELTKEVKATKNIRYILDIPANVKDKLPLMVFLHGSGERGDNLEMVKAHSPFTYKNLIKESVAILAPQCPAGEWWDTDAIYALIQEIQQKYPIDQSRIIITGLSMGGWGTLKLAMEHPEMFSAVAAVCPPVDRLMKVKAQQFQNLPTKLFHGGNDDIVSPMNSIDMYQAIRKYNKNVELILFPNDNHNSWDSTYSNPAVYEWMLAQKKNTVK